LKNLLLFVNGRGVSVIGSLAKFSFGNNFETLTRIETASIVEQIGDFLNLPLKEAQVRRLDVGHNLIMEQPVIEYLNRLGMARYYQKMWECGNRQTLYHENGRRLMCFYDKGAEAQRDPIPEPFRHRHVLRYELRFKSRLGHQFMQPRVTASHLYEEWFYNALLDRWQREYFSVRRKKLPLSKLNVDGVKQLEQSLALLGIQALGGEDNVLDVIKAARLQGKLGKTQYHRQRQKVRNIAYCAKPSELANDVMLELDEKVRRAVVNCI
jgi:hypothetical protein